MPYHDYDNLLQNNLEWAAEKRSQDPDYVGNLTKGREATVLIFESDTSL